jgi:hypothetical protein
MSNTKKVPTAQAAQITLTSEQRNQLISQGVPNDMFEVLEVSELLELLEASENESLTIRVKSQRTNVCTELVEDFKNAEMITMTKEQLAEKIRIMNQNSFFTITKNKEPFVLTDSKTVKMFMLVKAYNFKNEAVNKQTEAAVTEADKVKISVAKWLVRGKAIVNEICNTQHAKSFNGYKLGYSMSIDGKEITFTRDTQEAK